MGDFLVIEYWADPGAVAAVLPDGLTPFADDPGRCAALFVDWQSCSDSGEELPRHDDALRASSCVVIRRTIGRGLARARLDRVEISAIDFALRQRPQRRPNLLQRPQFVAGRRLRFHHTMHCGCL